MDRPLLHCFHLNITMSVYIVISLVQMHCTQVLRKLMYTYVQELQNMYNLLNEFISERPIVAVQFSCSMYLNVAHDEWSFYNIITNETSFFTTTSCNATTEPTVLWKARFTKVSSHCFTVHRGRWLQCCLSLLPLQLHSSLNRNQSSSGLERCEARTLHTLTWSVT